MPDSESERALARASWPIRRVELEAEGADEDLSATTTAEQRLQMMWRLAEDAWALAGRPVPSYARSEMPGRVLRGRQ